MPKEQTQHDREIRDLNAETARLRAENAKLRAENKDRWREHDERMREYDKRADKALAIAEKNSKYFGDNGKSLEAQCCNTLMKTMQINGIKLDDFHWRRKNAICYAEVGIIGAEVDIIGFNGKVVMPIEVKRTLSADDVRRFAEVRVGRFKKAFPQYAAGKQTIPVIIFAMPRTGVDADGKPEDPVQLALDLGLTVLQSTGKNQLSPITDPDQVISRPHQTTDLT